MEEALNNADVEYDEDEWAKYVLIRSWLECQNWGSTTALLVSIEGRFLVATTYGDSCFIQLRKREDSDWEIVYRSQPQTHSFSCPYQLMRKPLKGLHDYDSADVQWEQELFCSPDRTNLRHGDIIVAGSDGLFDNLFDEEIKNLVRTNTAFT